MRIKLTDLAVRRLPYSEKGQKRYWDENTPAFGVICFRRTKSFVIMYGERRKIETIGNYPAVSLSEARREAKRLLATKTANKRTTAFPSARSAYLEESKGRIRPATIRQYTRCLGYLDFSGDVNEITRADLLPILSRPHTTISFKTFFNWCIRNDLIDRNPLIGEPVPMPHPRTRVLSPNELKQVWQYDHKPFSDILKLLILTGQRRGEMLKLTPSWITDVVTIPASVTKNKREHVFPYGELTKQYLKPYSFNSWSKSKNRLDKVVPLPQWTIHDLRRTFATIHAEIGTPIQVTEKLLNHVSGTQGGIVGIYQQHGYMNEMKQAVLTYEDHIAKIVSA